MEPKTRKMFKSEKPKSKKLSKSQKLTKLGKKLLKSRNSPNFNAKKDGLSFLTSKARTAFNCLQLAFIKALNFCYFDPECHIQIEINALNYAIGNGLSQLILKTSSNGIVTKTNLGQ